MASRPDSIAKSNSTIASSGSCKGITPTPINLGSSEQKSDIALLCALVAP